MNTHGSVLMVVRWQAQQRQIEVKADDELHTIETAIQEIFQRQISQEFESYQVQFYDRSYQTYLDLHEAALPLFRQIIAKLASDTAPPKCSKSWRLKMVPKITRVGDAPIQLGGKTPMTKEVSSLHINHCTTQRASTPNQTMLAEDSQEVTFSSVPNDYHFRRRRSSVELIDTTFGHPPLPRQALAAPRNPDHPLNFRFEINIANQQRKQYESEMARKRASNGPSVGGVFLRAATDSAPQSADSNLYPIIEFQIPEDRAGECWSLFIYILTESDSEGIHYVHASKGIFDHITRVEDQFGRILNSKLVNPWKFELTSNDIRRRKYQLRLRVCNIRNLPQQRQEKLSIFPPLSQFIMYHDPTLLSVNSTSSLNFSSDKYHLGCLLICKNTVQDRCVSHLTIEENKRKSSNDEVQPKKAKLSEH